MAMSKALLNEYRLHAVTVLTGASAAMSQIDQMVKWSPIAAALAFFVASSSYVQPIGRIDEDNADAIDDIAINIAIDNKHP